MRDEDKSREQLLQELADLRQRLAARESAPAGEPARETPARTRADEMLRATIDNSPDFIYLKDLAGRFLLVNRRFESGFHKGEAQLLGKTDFDIHATAEQARAVRANDLRAIETGGPVEFEETAQLDDGPHSFVSVKFPVRDSHGVTYATGGISTDITERKQAEQERERLLTQAENERARLEAVLQQMPSGVAILAAPSGATILTNEQLVKMWRQESAFASSSEFGQLVGASPDGRAYGPEDWPIVRSIRDGEIVTNEEIRFQRQDGSWGTQIISSAPVRDRAGSIVAAVAVVTEISERQAAEEERERLLREVDAQRQRFEAVVEHAPAGIAVLRPPDFVFELVNPAYQAIGPGLAMIGRTVAEVFPDLAGEVLPILEDVVRTGRPFGAVDRHFRIRREPKAAPEDVYFTFFYEPMLDAAGRVEHVLVLVNETTQQVLVRRRVEELADVAQRRAAELQAVLDNMVDAVFVCDPNGRIVLSNPAASRLFGMPSFAAIKNLPAEFPTLFHLRHPDGRPLASSEMAMTRALAGQTVVDAEQVFHSPQLDQDRHVRVSASPIRDEENRVIGAVVVARDVTALTELDRLKDEFLTVAAHELKTPVTIMKGYAQALARASVDLSPPTRRMIDAIDRGADRINRIVQDLLDVTRLQAGRLELADERVDLARLAEDVVDRFALTTTSKHRPRVVQANPAVVRGDRSRIGEVLADLLDNAVRYSPAGGDVDVAVRAEGDRAVVSVRDQGVGIPRGKQARIFERFYRAHTRTQYDYGGMGVGLYIAREVIARQGGQMWFESAEGQGSTFYFDLPLTRE